MARFWLVRFIEANPAVHRFSIREITMKVLFSSLLSAAALVGGLVGAGAASAQGTWDLGGATCNPGGTPATASCTVGSVTATMSAWGNTGSGGVFVQGSLAEFDPNGFGAYTGSSETGTNWHHAFDNKTTACGSGSTHTNCGGSVEALLINFGSAKVSLSQVRIGSYSGDADLSVWRWDGPATGPTMSSIAPSLGSSTLTGWTLVGSNDMDIVNPYNTGNNKFSSYFLITTYFGAAATNLDSGNDAWKLKSFTANLCVGTLTGGNGSPGGNGSTCTPGQVSEPASLALVGVAMLGAGIVRRRGLRVQRG